ncbi:DUF421 domain-containing protein [Kushneria marisflavi]|uniref:Uncharacterized protein n=1 Tax=Kushneria marisflavi TaxID=157779 RepID=A0A240ULY8_9GAMM|nr:YetF domain-containing protein [Kushneria marisflavi]ART62135.1 hypothetical protein B9H00_02810 [Kushneria marisflavi]RKD87215.1 uncharacterized protein DUF421 [Kushneria marisflavi]
MNPILHTIVVGILSYLILIIVLRVSGKRTLSKWNAFDFVTTIALGSILATALTSTQVSLAQSITAFVVIVMLQFVITFFSVRSRGVLKLIKSQPTLLLFRGQYCCDAMQRERVAKTEIMAAIREKGMADVEKVHAVVLETDGSFSVIGSAGDHDSALEGVDGLPGQ